MKKVFFLVTIIIIACNSSKKEKQVEESAEQIVNIVETKQELSEKADSIVVAEIELDSISKIASKEKKKTAKKIKEAIKKETQKIIKKEEAIIEKIVAKENVIEAIKKPKIIEKPAAIIEKEIIKQDAKTPETTPIFNHKPWTVFLKKHVNSNGDVNYAAIHTDESELKAYLNQFIKTTPKSSWSKNEKLAYWINAYNAFTIKLIVDNYPLKSIKDIQNPWDKKFIPIDGNLISLNHIEHEILRKMGEPRIHFAINCASISCPQLLNEAFEADKINSQLTKVAKNFINNPKKNSLSKDEIKISKIFKWFKKDFETKGSIIDFLNTYSGITIDTGAKVGFLDYNWNLNKQ